MRTRLLLCLECKWTTFYLTDENKLQCANCGEEHPELMIKEIDKNEQ